LFFDLARAAIAAVTRRVEATDSIARCRDMNRTPLAESKVLGSTPAAWCTWGSAVVSDALRAKGKSFQAMDGGLRPLLAESSIAGPAFTVRCYPGATWALEQALELAAPGDILVVDAGGTSDVIIMGGLMSRRAAHRRIAGAIVDGSVRDVDEITAIGFPVFSRHVCPRAGTTAEIGEWQTTICCGRIPIRPEDWIVADRSGIVVVPTELLADVAAQAEAIHRRERLIDEGLRTGMTLTEAVAAAKSCED
jgi:regulator of RNase E activity RraA